MASENGPEPTQPTRAAQAGPADDPLPEAIALAQGAADAGLGLKLLGGLAVRVLCPDFPPRLRIGQDMDFACMSKGRKNVVAYLEKSGCQPDRRFNNLNGDRQMYFTAPSGRPIDVMVDRLTMCHTLDFRPAFGRLPLTVDAVDVLLSKLQIVELNEKDARDTLHLLSGVPVSGSGTAGPESGASIDSDRFGKLLGADWGWWRTVTAQPEEAARAGRRAPRAAAARSRRSTRSRSPRTCSSWPSRRRRASSGSCGRTSATASAGTSCPKRWITDTGGALARVTRIPGVFRPELSASPRNPPRVPAASRRRHLPS